MFNAQSLLILLDIQNRAFWRDLYEWTIAHFWQDNAYADTSDYESRGRFHIRDRHVPFASS